MNWQNYIVSDRDVLLGKPTIKGTRISIIKHIIGLLAQGGPKRKFLKIFQDLQKNHYKRCLLTFKSASMMAFCLHPARQLNLYREVVSQ